MFKTGLELENQSKKVGYLTLRQSFTILGAPKGSYSIILVHQTCKLESLSSKLCVAILLKVTKCVGFGYANQCKVSRPLFSLHPLLVGYETCN
jgi:hypothetical protein